jgi:hypothetical protein
MDMIELTDEPVWGADERAGRDPADTEITGPGDEGAEPGELPSRRAANLPLRRRVRRMDDPEVLERVLAGLLDLP